MFISKALAVGLASSATAQLLVNKASIDRMKALKDSAQGNIAIDSTQDQQPLLHTKTSNVKDLPPFEAGKYTVVEQDNTTCATYGESQWSGTVDVTDTHRLFYWFFDSRNDPENDPIIFWINGGPGGSSMMGLFDEMGPCWLEPESNATIPNPWSWNNNASLLFIDQPAGVGFASLAEGAPVPKVDLDGAQDFQVFLNIFFNEAFPSKAHLPIHFAAESYGGHYAPTYVKHILDSRAYDSRSAFWGNIASLILVDAVVDFTGPPVGAYELLCSDFRGGDVISEEACRNIELALPECEALGRSCDLSYDGWECWAMMEFCEATVSGYYWDEVEKGLRNPYNSKSSTQRSRESEAYTQPVGLPCPDFPECTDTRKGNFSHYLNQPEIKEALDFPPSFTYQPINYELNTAYTDNRTPFKPTTAEVSAILDAHRTPGLGDIKLLVLQGNEDFVVNTPGNVWVYDNLRWTGQPEYRITQWQALKEEELATTGFWKGTRDGRLVFVGVDGAGHTVPGDVREGSWRIAQKWIEGGWAA